MQLLHFFALVIYLLILVAGANAGDCRTGKFCTAQYAPVCAIRNRGRIERRTFPNKCVFNIAVKCGEGWRRAKDGEC